MPRIPIIEGIGLILAIIDFAGWTPRLQASIRKLKTGLLKYAMVQEPESEAFNRFMNYFIATNIILLTGAWIVYGFVNVDWPPVRGVWDIVLIIIGCLLAFILSLILASLSLLSFFGVMYLVLWLLAAILYVMRLWPRGIIGTFCLILAIISFIYR